MTPVITSNSDMGNCVCCGEQPSYARYSNNKENEVDLENILGSILEMDPSLQDREEGVTKINSWIDEVSPEIAMSPEHLEISRWKCIKYWEAQHSSEVYGNDYATGLKLTGSCVRFYFERKPDGTSPRLVIEHCGRPVHVQDESNKCIRRWVKNIKLKSWRPFRKSAARRSSVSSHCEIVADVASDRYS